MGRRLKHGLSLGLASPAGRGLHRLHGLESGLVLARRLGLALRLAMVLRLALGLAMMLRRGLVLGLAMVTGLGSRP